MDSPASDGARDGSRFAGRVAAQQQMLGDLRELHVGECTRLTDRAFGGISTRALGLERLHCRGVAGLTDEGLGFLHVEPEHQHARGDKLRALDLSRCCALSDRAIDAICRACPSLEDVDVSFCLRLTDRATRSICEDPRPGRCVVPFEMLRVVAATRLRGRSARRPPRPVSADDPRGTRPNTRVRETSARPRASQATTAPR